MRRSDAALFGARAIAWALLVGGWCVLGGLAQRHAPAGLLALAPLALWLAATAATHAALRHTPPGPRATALVLAAVLAGAAALLGGWPGGAAPIAGLALLWGPALALATHQVHGLRRRPAGTPGTGTAPPRRPSAHAVLAAASLGAGAAWALAGDPAAVAARPGTVGAALAALAALALALPALAGGAPGRRDTAPARTCRRAGVDCALTWPTLAQWRQPAAWPALAASLAMLPMMSALPALADLCAQAGLPPTAGAAAHLGAMLLPAWGVALLPASALPAVRPALVGLLAGGAAAALAAPGAAGLMAAMLLQSMAWSAAWAASTLRADADPRLVAPGAGPVASLVASVAALAALAGLAGTPGGGLSPWVAAHTVLGVLAIAGALASGGPAGRGDGTRAWPARG